MKQLQRNGERGNQLYRCLIEEQSEDEPFLQVYWAWGAHLGFAIEKALSAARENDLENPTIREADPCDINSIEADIHPGREADVFFALMRISFPPEPTFVFPVGIVPSGTADEEAIDAEDVFAGYRRSRDEEGLIEIAVNIADSDLLPLYKSLLKLQVSYETFWYRIHGHWGGSEDQIFENSSMTTPKAIVDHLDAHLFDSVFNGFVSLTAYTKEGATNVNISEHKRIVVLTYSNSIADAAEATLKDEGLSHHDDIVSFDEKIHHRHYRPSRSLDRPELIANLTESGFKLWNPNCPADEE